MTRVEQTAIAQVELVGKTRKRHHHLRQGSGSQDFPFPRTSRVVGYFNETTGETGFIPAHKVKNVYPSDLLHLPREAAGRIDLAGQKPALSTALKQRTTASGVDMNQVYRQKGGDPDYRPKKTGGFFFSSTPAEIAAERKKRQGRR